MFEFQPLILDAVNNGRQINQIPMLYMYPPSKQLNTCPDVDCLEIQTYLLLSKFEFGIKNHTENNFASNSKLPCVVVGDEVFSGREILKLVIKSVSKIDQGLNINDFLNKDQHARCIALHASIEARLDFALEYELWYELPTFQSITAQNSYPWPLSYLIPSIKRKKKIEQMLGKSPVILTSQIYARAITMLGTLSLFLGDQDYFFGVHPTSLDSCVFARLHVILSLLPADSRLRSLVSEHDNLNRFAKRIWKTYYRQ